MVSLQKNAMVTVIFRILCLSFFSPYIFASDSPGLPGIMLFTASQDKNWDVYAWYGDTQRIVRLTKTLYDEKSPALSPDKSTVAYVTTDGRLMLRDSHSGKEEVVDTQGFSGLWDSPSFSQNGRYLAASYFATRDSDHAQIAIIDLRTRQANIPIDQFGSQFDPAWDPKGGRIIYGYTHCSSACGHVIQEPWLLNTGRHSANQLLMTNSNASGFSWSPDGNHIAFSADIDGNYDIWLLEIDTKRLTKLTTYPGLDDAPAFGPDGKRIAFLSNRSGRKGIWIKDLESGSVMPFKPLPDNDVSYNYIDWK